MERKNSVAKKWKTQGRVGDAWSAAHPSNKSSSPNLVEWSVAKRLWRQSSEVVGEKNIYQRRQRLPSLFAKKHEPIAKPRIFPTCRLSSALLQDWSMTQNHKLLYRWIEGGREGGRKMGRWLIGWVRARLCFLKRTWHSGAVQRPFDDKAPYSDHSMVIGEIGLEHECLLLIDGTIRADSSDYRLGQLQLVNHGCAGTHGCNTVCEWVSYGELGMYVLTSSREIRKAKTLPSNIISSAPPRKQAYWLMER